MKNKQNPLRFAANELEADKALRDNPRAEKFAIVTHKKTGLSRILAWDNEEWHPVGPDFESMEQASGILNLVAQEASQKGLPLLPVLRKIDQNTIEAGEMVPSKLTDREWLLAFEKSQDVPSNPVPVQDWFPARPIRINYGRNNN